ncbi:MAG: peptidoglycan DD-metalloendopeptidase family protein [Rhodocyclales bacterium]|nr:peptidoglycan DD-metalloendopeptidase family protein [Rhodocyclales bacterium]
MNILRRLLMVTAAAFLGACASHGPAPVEERGVQPATTKAAPATPVADRAGFYTVKKGDTLYSIALDHGQDYKDVAAWNYLENPNLIKIGQQLRVVPPESAAPVAVSKPVSSSGPVEIRNTPAPASANTDSLKREPRGGKLPWSEEALAKARQGEGAKAVEAKPAAAEKPAEKPVDKPAEKPAVAGDDVDWMWPAGGKLMTTYSEAGNKGIDIAGKLGDPVVAAAGGIVSYAGAGLRGYGNLVVVRHNANLLSVYAHNSKLLVKEKDTVSKGQKIAEIGSSDADSPRLHFEIRRQGKPSDPQKFLPPR